MKPRTGRKPPPRIVARFVAISWRDLAMSFGPILLASIAALWLAVRLIQPAPPDSLTISAGPRGSTFWNAAQQYKTILARNGITLRVLESEGSAQNLERLADPSSRVDAAFVQDGLANHVPDGLVSLGSVAYVPLAVFYRGPAITRLSQFAGEKLAIGAPGSGTRALALVLLDANGIAPGGATQLLPLSGDEAAKALTDGRVDAAFLTGDSAQPPVISRLYRTPGVRLFDFAQAEAYARRFPYLTAISLPMGALDLGRNLPATDIRMIAPTEELVARDSLHPALSDLLIEAAQEVHGKASLLQRAGEFPALRGEDFPISDDAARYYKSGKSFLYRVLPFWLASLADRLLVLLVPVVVVLIPGLRLVPSLYAWRVKSRIYRRYGALIGIEREALNENGEARATASEPERRALLRRLDAIEKSVNSLKMPLAYAGQFYVLREHIGFVRARLLGAQAGNDANDDDDDDGDTGRGGPGVTVPDAADAADTTDAGCGKAQAGDASAPAPRAAGASGRPRTPRDG
ncbi:C4-dicarboxylate ABC transporter substrate-binding protein [Burkholderia sp. WAC0059]|uniref:TAXI family TRAP transporter solute-binding subunit n=1 Tax=Burkholderia sp. WAC0059 TaxID=2066022 RepID=UPI000C7ED424|nr:TAXI family TRAP transporter solute-binding subunit [Burkholderia sp. WAC0059]PLZ03240.1 C4-dicarboxylate ABC transporter substrate-binding protein [Burkholderia sp. WAC0059]